LVLLGETFRRALEEGCRTYEFLRGEEEYKREWVSEVRTTQSILVVGSTAGRLLSAGERTAARARTSARHVAGPRLRASVRSARRAVGGST
jgi:CelD/BcsL family acetyltransferase involved in cellulose biosynthesis